jgi:hypothetical protein
MSRRLFPSVSSLLVGATLFGAMACGGSKKSMSAEVGGTADSSAAAGTSELLCNFSDRSDVAVVVSTSPGAEVPNVRRVYRVLGTGEDAREVMVCREVDTNFDGRSDVVRFYSPEGESLREAADSDYSGATDTWLEFTKGGVSKVSRDTTANGKPDEIRYYVRGVLRRIERDTSGNTQPDVWEIYRDGKLERVGTDLNGDGRVDRWDRDKLAQKAAEDAEKAKANAAPGAAAEAGDKSQ